MRKIFFIIIFLAALPSSAFVTEFFDSFYFNYLSIYGIEEKDREDLDFLFEVSKNKTTAFENILNSAQSRAEREEAIYLIDGEYKDFAENINFELNYTNHCLANKKDLKKLKTAHKKFIRRLKKCYLG